MLVRVFMALLTFTVVAAISIASFAGGIYLSIYYTQTFGLIALFLIIAGVSALFFIFRNH